MEKKISPILSRDGTDVKRVRGARNACVYSSVRNLVGGALLPLGRGRRSGMRITPRPQVFLLIFSSAVALSGEQLNGWRHVGHCLVCLQVCFGEYGASRTPGGEM